MKKYLLAFFAIILFVPFFNAQAANVCAGKTWKSCPTGKTFICLNNKPACVIMTAAIEETAPQLYVAGSMDLQIQQIVVFVNKLSKMIFDLQKAKSTTSQSVKSSSSSNKTNDVEINLVAGEEGEVEWDVDTKSENGYMLLWSKNSNPIYPKRSGDYYRYYSSPSATVGKLGSSGGTGTFYTRICALNDDMECTGYSNEIKVTAPED